MATRAHCRRAARPPGGGVAASTRPRGHNGARDRGQGHLRRWRAAPVRRPQRRARDAARRRLAGQLPVDRAARTRPRPSSTRSTRSCSCTPWPSRTPSRAASGPRSSCTRPVVFVVLKPLRYVEETLDIETGEVMCFVGDRFIVTVRRGEAATRWPGCASGSRPSPSALRLRPDGGAARHRGHRRRQLHASSTREVSADLDEIEERVFSGADMDSSTIYRLKREVLEFRRAAAPAGGAADGAARGRELARHRPRAAPAVPRRRPTTCRPSSTTSSPTTGCSPTCSAPTSRRSRCSRTPTCAASRRGSRSPPCRR